MPTTYEELNRRFRAITRRHAELENNLRTADGVLDFEREGYARLKKEHEAERDELQILAGEILTTAIIIYSQVDDTVEDSPVPAVLKAYGRKLGFDA